MSWNNGIKRRRFEALQKKLAESYRKQNMKEAQIKALYDFDLAEFKSNRRYHTYTQPFQTAEFEEYDSDESDNGLLKYFFEQLTCSIDDIQCQSRFWWIETIENTIKNKRLESINKDRKGSKW